MATKRQLTKTEVRGTRSQTLYFEGEATCVRDLVAIDFPVMPDLLDVVEDYFSPDDPNYKDAVNMAEELSLLTRAYYMQFISFFQKNEKDISMRSALRSLHERFTRIPHPYIDPNTKQILKIQEDNYERIIIKQNPRKRKTRFRRGTANV